MKIEKIELQNFRSVGNQPAVVEWTENDKLTLIKAKNGVGKSTLFYAIAFCLFGVNLQTKGQSKTHNPISNLINDINKKELLVTIHLSNGYKIVRGLKPNIFEVYNADGIDVANASSKTIDQQWLEDNVLLTDYNTFARTTMLTAKPTTVPFIYMTPQERKKHIENLLGIEIFRQLGEITRTKESKLKVDKKGYIDKTDNLKTQIEMIDNFIESSKSNASMIDKDTLIAQQQEYKKQLETLKTDYTKLKEQQVSINEDRFIVIEKELESLNRDNSKLTKDNILIEHKVNDIKRQKQSHIEAVEKAKNNDAPCDTSMRLTCPLVTSMIPHFDECESKKLLEYMKDTYTLNKKTIEGNNKKIDSLTKEYDDLKELIKQQNDINTKLIDITNNANIIKERYKSIDEKLSSYDKIEEDNKKKIEEYKAKKINLEKEIHESDKHIDEIDDDLRALSLIKERVLSNSIKEELFGYYTPFFQGEVNNLLDKFFEDDNISVSVEISPLFEITLYKNGTKSNIFNLSEGQIGSLNFAFVFGFLRLTQEFYKESNLDLLYIDEILDIGLDSFRLNSIVSHLKDISKDRDVTIISHNKELDFEMFDRILQPYLDEFNFTHFQTS